MWGVEGAWFKREGICVCLPQTHIGVQQKPTQHCKAILLQLKHTHTHTHTPSADSRYYTAESNTTLQSNSPPVKPHTQTQRQLQPLFSWPLQIGPSLSVSLFFFFASSEPPFADLVSPSLRNQVLCLHFSYSFQIPTHLITAALGSPPVPWKLI